MIGLINQRCRTSLLPKEQSYQSLHKLPLHRNIYMPLVKQVSVKVSDAVATVSASVCGEGGGNDPKTKKINQHMIFW